MRQTIMMLIIIGDNNDFHLHIPPVSLLPASSIQIQFAFSGAGYLWHFSYRHSLG